MTLLLALGLALCAQAAEFSWQTAPRELVVRKEPLAGARVLFYIPAGDRLMAGPEVKGFRKIRIRSEGKVKAGYVALHEFAPRDWREGASESDWALGPSLSYGQLVQSNKAFTTPDQVQYVTTDYVSSTIFPLVTAQLGRTSFWRLQAIWRQVQFKFSARSNVDNQSRDVELTHRMLGLALQKGWTADFFRPLYGAVGVEGDRALSTSLKINGSELATDSSNKPFYLALHAIGGLHFMFSERWSLYFEGRYNWVANQSPVLTGTDFSLALLYWP